MTQPIDRETALQILTDAGCPNGYLASFALHHPQWDWMQTALNLAVAHSRKDAEPVDIRAAMKRAFNLGQTYWQQADSEYVSQQNKSDATRAKFNELLESTMDHVSNPPEADKLLQQALEALEYRLQQTRPIHQADSVMEAIRTYLENKNA